MRTALESVCGGGTIRGLYGTPATGAELTGFGSGSGIRGAKVEGRGAGIACSGDDVTESTILEAGGDGSAIACQRSWQSSCGSSSFTEISVPFCWPGKLTNENITNTLKRNPNYESEFNDQSNYEMGFPPLFNDSQIYTEIDRKSI